MSRTFDRPTGRVCASVLVNARIRELFRAARGRSLTAAEQAEYRRLLAVWVVADRSEQGGEWVTVA